MATSKTGKGNQMALSLDFKELDISPPEAARLPLLFCNAPFFKPTDNRKRGSTGWDDDEGESFREGDWEWHRFGPGLNTYDLETLVAVYQLVNMNTRSSERNFKLIHTALASGASRTTPKTIGEIGIADDIVITGEIEERRQFGVVTPTSINSYIGRSVNDRALDECRASIRRLGKQTSKFVNHKTGKSQYPVPFFNVIENEAGAFVINFPPEIISILRNFIDFNLRVYRQLTDLGQAMMLWMRPLKGEHSILLTDALQKSSYEGSLKEFKRALLVGRPDRNVRPVIGSMLQLGFLSHGEVVGTGRKQPFELIFVR